MQMRLRRLNTMFYTDTLFSKVTSLRGMNAAQVYANKDMVSVHPLASKASVDVSLQEFLERIGIPNAMISDGAAEQTGPNSKFRKLAQHLRIQMRMTEPYSLWQNKVERTIGTNMVWLSVPKRLWDYGLVYEGKLMSLISRSPEGRTGVERITGDTPDISEFMDFGFYDRMWYWGKPSDDNNPKMGRWLGVAHRIGSAMCYYVLSKTGKVLTRTTVQHVTLLEMATDDVKAKAEAFNVSLRGRLYDANFVTTDDVFVGHFLEDKVDREEDAIAEENAIEQDDFTGDACNQYVGAELMLPSGDGMIKGS
jgi:hypothetical protein